MDPTVEGIAAIAFLGLLVTLPFSFLSQDVDDARFWYGWFRWRRWDVFMATVLAVLIFAYVGGVGDLDRVTGMLAPIATALRDLSPF